MTELVNKAGKRIKFAPNQVSYMLENGWSKAAEAKQETKKTKPKPSEAKK